MADQPNGASEASSVESFTDSWIQLDNKNGSSLQNSPKFSDEEEMADVLADAQAESARRELNVPQQITKVFLQMLSVDSLRKRNIKQPEEKLKSTQADDNLSIKSNIEIDIKKTKSRSFFESSAFFISSLIMSHTLVFVLGIVVGRRYLSPARTI